MMSTDGDRAWQPPPANNDLNPSPLSVVAELLVLAIGLWLTPKAIELFGPKFEIEALRGGSRAPSVSSVIALIVAGVLALICTVYAIRKKTVYITVVIGAAAFGLFVEFFNMTVFKTYVYEESYFMLMGKVPLTIVLCWGAIIYSAMRTSDFLDLKWYLKPIYDGMLALTIDLALDPVAVSLPLWKWVVNPEMPMKAEFLDIPLANFYGWYMLVFCYSLAVRAGFRYWPARLRGPWTGAIVSTLAIPCAFVLFMISLVAYYVLLKFGSMPEALILSLLLGANLLLVLIYLPAADHDDDPNLISFISPLMLHGFVMFEYYFAGLYRELNTQGTATKTEGLILLLPTVAAFSLISFAWPFLDGLKKYFQGVERVAHHRGVRSQGIERAAPANPARGAGPDR